MSSRRIPEPGEVLAERYRIVRLIGEGGMGAVFEAENTVTQKRVAIKLMHPALGQNSEAAQRLVREAQASCRIRHQNVVDVYDVVREENALFLIMELLEGEPLSALLERGGVPAHEFIELVLKAMRGVAAAHRVGVIHRDIHPGNILLAREPPNALLVPKVLDFGIAKVRDDQEHALTGSGVTMGTPLYMSYEQLCSARDIDARTDVYPFGVILYQGLTGQPPFAANALTELVIKLATEEPPSPKLLAPEIPSALDRLIGWALQRDRDKRIQTMEAFIDELEPFASARAFRTQMTDAQRTLPAIVPRGFVQRASPAPSAPPVAPVWSELAPARASDPPFVASEAPAPAHEASSAPPASMARATPSAAPPASLAQPARRHESKLLPMAFVAAATLFVMALGTFVVRRFSAWSARGQSAHAPIAPPPLPALEAGLGVVESPSLELTPPASDAELAARAAESPIAGADAGAAPLKPLTAPVPTVTRPVAASPRTPAPPARRRFRAGEARPLDF